MSRRLDTTVCSRSASASMVLLNDWTSLADHSTSVLSRLVAAALMLASGVRRSCETAARSASRTLFASARAAADGGLGLEPQRGLDELQLRDERAEQPAVLGGERAARRPRASSRSRARLRRRRCRASTGPARRPTRRVRQPSIVGASTATESSIQGPAQLGDESMLRLVVEHRGDRTPARPAPRSRPAPVPAVRSGSRGGPRGRSPVPRPRRTRRGPGRPRRARTGSCASARCRTSRRGGTRPATRRSPGPGRPAPRPRPDRAGAAAACRGHPSRRAAGSARGRRSGMPTSAQTQAMARDRGERGAGGRTLPLPHRARGGVGRFVGRDDMDVDRTRRPGSPG